MQAKRRKRPVRHTASKGFWLLTAFLLAVLFFLLLALEQRLRPVAMTAARMKSRELCVNRMQQAVRKTLDESPELYEEVFAVQQDASGRLRGAMCDPLAMNTLQNTLEEIAGTALTGQGVLEFHIPIGSLTGFQLLSGRGPGLPVRAMPLSYVQSRIVTGFQAAGINQTLLNVDIVLSVNMGTLLAGVQTGEEVETQVRIAQLMVVGDVPQVFAARP